MNLPLDGGGILVGMAGNTQRLCGGGDQLHAGYIFVHAYLVTAQAPHGDRRVDCLTLGFVFVTLNARRGISLGVERDVVQRCPGGHGDDRERQYDDGEGNPTLVVRALREPHRIQLPPTDLQGGGGA